MDVVYLVVDFASGHIVSLVAPIPIIDQMNSFHIRLRAFNQDCEREKNIKMAENMLQIST